MSEELRPHIAGKLAEAELARYPFPHLIIEDFFPCDIYADILRYNPFHNNSGREWFSREEARKQKTKSPYWTRKQIDLHNHRYFEGTPEQLAFWSRISACFLSDHWFERLVIDKYKEYFVIRFGELVESEDFCSLFRKEMFLQRHEAGFSIGPHTDIPPRVFTCIFSFADREGFEEYGTRLCVHRDPLVRCWGNDHHPPDDFIVRKLAPYKPNNFLLFFKTRQSFHSVKTIDETVPNQRYGMQLQFYEPPRGLLRDLSEPDLIAARLSIAP